MSKPLDGIKVLDLSKVLAGPLCAQYLGDLGAEVIKVEAVGQGDETRGWPPFPAPGLGTVFLSANRNKRSIAINMKSDKGRKLVHELAKSADVAIESFGTGVAERLGIDAASLCALLLIKNITLEINSSFDGRFASDSMSLTSMALPSTTAALKENTGLAFAHFESNFASATGSLFERATAVAPSNCPCTCSIGVPAAARMASVFLTTR